MQYVIGLVLLCLSGASIGLLDGFPVDALPGIGAGIAVALALVWAYAVSANHDVFARAADAVHNAALLLTAIVAVLVQWRERSEPVVTAGWLIAAAAAFAWHAHRDQRLRALLTTMALLAMSLPYLGCVDMQGRDLRGNTLTFGLAVLSSLWLAFTLARPTPLLVAARSTGLWAYGAVGVAAMLLRVVVEPTGTLDLAGPHLFMDLVGPILMAVVLIVTAYLSRSLIPSGAAVLIAVILLPELKAHLSLVFPWIQWGTGFGSSISALVLILIAFAVRRAPGLQSLEVGDQFLGTEPFPLRRTDASLFTIPLITSVLFLCAKVTTYSFLVNLESGGKLPLRTSVAMLVIAVAWSLLAVYLRRALPTYVACFAALAGVHFLLPHVAPGLLPSGRSSCTAWRCRRSLRSIHGSPAARAGSRPFSHGRSGTY
jgi:hypothetical protein